MPDFYRMFSSPNDSPKDGTLHSIALDQLAEYQNMASEWQTYSDDQRHNRCTECHQNIWFSKDPMGREYVYQPEEIVALLVSHIRQCHSGQS